MGKTLTKSKDDVVARTTKFDMEVDDMIMEVQGELLKRKQRVSINEVVNDLIKKGFETLKREQAA